MPVEGAETEQCGSVCFMKTIRWLRFSGALRCSCFSGTIIGKIQWSEKKAEIICYLGGCTFGVYLIHAFFRDILHRAGFDSMFINNTVIAVPVVAAVIFITSLIAVILIRHIPVLKKWIV